MPKGKPELKEKLNEWVDTNLQNGKLNTTYEKYHSEPIPDEVMNRNKQ